MAPGFSGMRPCSHRILLALMLVGAAATSPAQSTVSTKQLDNGMYVIVSQNPSAAYVTLQMVLRAGANVQVEAADAGMAHLLEHMLFRRGATGMIEDELTKLDGGGMNGGTDDEWVQYYFGVPPKNLAAGLELIGKMVRRPT